MKKVAIIGLGNFGYALLKHFDVKNNGSYELVGFDRKKEVTKYFNTHRKHPFLFKSTKISQDVELTHSIKRAVYDADYLILAVSSNALCQVLEKISHSLTKPVIVVNTAKALEYHTGDRFSTIAEKVLKRKLHAYAVIAGGTIAADLFRKDPLGVDIACKDALVLKDLTHLLNSYNLSVYPTTDVVGVEYASAFKNVIAILAGIIKGMRFSYGSETYVISRAAYEVEELIVKEFGGERKTFSMQSQSWGNDLWMSCTGNTRNRQFGVLIGKGYSVKQALSTMDKARKTVEGMYTIRVLGTLKTLHRYPLLYFLHEFFNNKEDLSKIEKIIFNEKL